MGRKRKFIDKKTSTVYHVLYRSSADAESDPTGGEFDLVSDADLFLQRAKAAHEASKKHPLDWLRDKPEDYVNDDTARNELYDLGLPDDGYNYLQHLRVLNAGSGAVLRADTPQASTSQKEGDDTSEKVIEGFIPPEEDVAFIDARSLAVEEAAEAEEQVKQHRAGISAFARRVQDSDRIRNHSAVREIGEALAALEVYDDDIITEEDREFETILGEGDLLDDFILEASRTVPVDTQEPAVDDEEPEDSDWEFDSDEDDDDGDEPHALIPTEARSRRGGSSVASSFWRAPRHDRTDAMSVIDERFEKLALEYEDDDIGSLEEEVQDASPEEPGVKDPRIQAALDDYMQNYRKGNEVAELPVGWNLNDLTPEQVNQLDDELIAKLKAREAYYRQVEDEANGVPEPIVEYEQRKPKEQWDCESVLSLTSNLENHPGRIRDPSSKKRVAAVEPEPFKLSSKTGLPLGVKGITLHMDAEDVSDDEGERLNLGEARSKSETPAEKKLRKSAVKESRKIARETKKGLKSMYTQEMVKAQKHASTNQGANASIFFIP